MKEEKKRSVAKSVTWRICATLTTVILVYLFTGEIAIAFSLGFVEIFIKMAVYYFHERAWDNIGWARKIKGN